MMELKITYCQLMRWKDYVDEFICTSTNFTFREQAEIDKGTIRIMLRRGPENFREILVYRTRKKILRVMVELDFLKRMTDYIDAFIENCRLYMQIQEAKRDKVRVAKLKRMFEPRNRELRKYFKLKVKDAA